MIFLLINKLEKSGELKRLAGAGIIPPHVLTYREIYMDYQKNIKVGMTKMEALHKTSIEMRVSDGIVYRAKNLMERK